MQLWKVDVKSPHIDALFSHKSTAVVANAKKHLQITSYRLQILVVLNKCINEIRRSNRLLEFLEKPTKEVI